jgi:hypothetical protein
MNVKEIKSKMVDAVSVNIAAIGADTLNWIAIIVGHCVFLPNVLALLTGLTDKTPGVDVVLLVQFMLLLSFIRSILVKDTVAAVTHGIGWFGQSLLLAMIVFK